MRRSNRRNQPLEDTFTDPMNYGIVTSTTFETPLSRLDAFDVMATLPLKLLAEAGVKVILNDELCPGVSVQRSRIC
jgi:hypothetical protein